MSEPVIVSDPPPHPKDYRAPLALAQLVILGLLVLVAVGTSAYMVTVGVDLRAAQQRIDCQAAQTDQLREAAAIERDGLRPLFTAIPTGDTSAIYTALDGYRQATDRADGVRQSIPACQPPPPEGE